MKTFRCIDFETTGVPSEDERHAVCEAGWTDVAIDAAAVPVIDLPVASLCNPGRLMPIEAMAIHHLRDCDLADQPQQTTVFMQMMVGADYFVAHNIDFEREFFGGGETPWLCTFKSALRVWPDAPGHKVQELRYWLKFDDDPAFNRLMAFPAHRAGPDSYVTAHLLCRLLLEVTVEQMLHWSSGPALLSICYMKKHKGTKWSNVPADYLDWIVNKSDITDRDIKATAKFYLKKRMAA